jgi:hypothetical protein
MAKKYWRPPPGYYDEHRRQAIAEIAAKLPELVDNAMKRVMYCF